MFVSRNADRKLPDGNNAAAHIYMTVNILLFGQIYTMYRLHKRELVPDVACDVTLCDRQ